jgi:aspartyl-tRNA(Asn)/glutamyl-tRNA(Gln) amidotransferase subunit A
MKTIAHSMKSLAAGGKSRGLVEECLARISDAAGEGERTFLKTHAAQALAAADFFDRQRASGIGLPPFAGIPISVKDLFDVAGDVTTAGSRILRDAAPATRDAPAVARLRAAGFIVIGRTNMTEFAFSGIGINPHYGTPLNPFDRKAGRIPGGSSSGAAVSVCDGMAIGAIGTDTGGSCRIPAALCGIAGFKPTAARVPKEGAFPLSMTLDSVGPLGATVECCAMLDAVLAGDPALDLVPFPLSGLRLAVPQTLVLDNLDAAVAQAFDASLARLRHAGVRISEIPLSELTELAVINGKGGLVTAESYAIHRPLIAKGEKMYDARVLVRILRGREQDAADYIELLDARAAFIRRVRSVTAPYDALVMPTTPLVAPRVADLADDKDYRRINMFMLRNPSIANFIDGCSISIPCQRAGDAPVGLMLFGEHHSDRRLLSIAAAMEPLLAPRGAPEVADAAE